ncbi:MAG: lipase [Muribaculaceae bacterium]|nr:lipase [Muribaculaceae bacterium]
MKKHVIKTLVLTAFFGLTFPSPVHADGWGGFERYAASNEQLKKEKTDDRVVFIGNSITDHWFRDRTDFVAAHPNYVGRGISGQTTYAFVTRFRQDVTELEPAVVVINGGINDIAENSHPYNEDITFGHIQTMIEQSIMHGSEVILTTLLPAARIPWRSEIENTPEKIKSLNLRIRNVAMLYSIPLVDYYTALVAEDGVSLKSEYTDDGLHPNAEGYKVMEALVVPQIEEVLQRIKNGRSAGSKK